MINNPHPWATSLDTLQAHVWALLVRGVKDRRASAHHMTLATVTPGGVPAARTVVLRAASKETASLDVHTDVHAGKVKDLQTTPFAAIHIWDTSAHLQIRLGAKVTILTGDEVATHWARVPDRSRLAYGGTPRTGEPIPDSFAYQKDPDPASFVILRLSITHMDILHLGAQHRRAYFERADNWSGQWLVP